MASKSKVYIAPSILSCDFSRIGEEIRDVENGGCDWIHVDVMDGHFVPNLTIGAPVVKHIRKTTKLPLDVHLMIENPMQYVPDFIKAGSDWITFHQEAVSQCGKIIEVIKQAGKKAGLSVKPGTPVNVLDPYLRDLDLVLIMTVEPGFGGQSFMPEMMEKVKQLRARFKGLISVDGGIQTETARQAISAGADVLVAGTSVFGQKDRGQAIRDLRG